ncbi:DUF2283 domain-containing protein [Candidatus Pacearchaeota archaeon]|nr:DUF2283 domain-containing protein [Candidatus Pacearchaeota archaeon]
MAKKIAHDYDSELDILHVYSEEIKNGIKGCLYFGDFNIDVGSGNKIVGIELEEASKNLGLSPKILSSPDKIDLIVRKTGNTLFMGIGILKGTISSSTHVTTPFIQTPLQIAN